MQYNCRKGLNRHVLQATVQNCTSVDIVRIFNGSCAYIKASTYTSNQILITFNDVIQPYNNKTQLVSLRIPIILMLFKMLNI